MPLANVLQALAGAALLFALYRYINTTLGVEQLGVWSVVLATASASRLADLGLSAGSDALRRPRSGTWRGGRRATRRRAHATSSRGQSALDADQPLAAIAQLQLIKV